MIKRILKTLAIFTVILFASCSKKSGKDVIITFWAMGLEGESVQKVVSAFEAENPGVKVKIQPIPWTAAQEKLITAYASDNLPDACQLGNTWIPQFVALNSLERLDSYSEKSLNARAENYFSGIWETNEIDNRLYGIPWYVDTRVMFYRKDLFKKVGYENPPKSWEELFDVCTKIKKLYKPTEEKYAIYLPSNEWSTFVIFGLQNNSNILKDKNTLGNFSGKEFSDAFDYLVKFHKNGLAPIGISQVNNVYQAFAEGFFSIYISGPWNVKDFYKWVKNPDDWGTAVLPSKDGLKPGVSLAGGSSLVMFKSSKHKKETWKWIEYLSRVKTQMEFYRITKDLPAVKSAWEVPELKNDEKMKAFYEQFNYVKATPKVPEWEQIAFDKLQGAAEYAIRGVKTSKQALEELDQKVNIVLEKRRWLTFQKSR